MTWHIYSCIPFISLCSKNQNSHGAVFVASIYLIPIKVCNRTKIKKTAKGMKKNLIILYKIVSVLKFCNTSVSIAGVSSLLYWTLRFMINMVHFFKIIDFCINIFVCICYKNLCVPFSCKKNAVHQIFEVNKINFKYHSWNIGLDCQVFRHEYMNFFKKLSLT